MSAVCRYGRVIFPLKQRKKNADIGELLGLIAVNLVIKKGR